MYNEYLINKLYKDLDIIHILNNLSNNHLYRFIHIINHYINFFELSNLIYKLYIKILIHREYNFEDIIHILSILSSNHLYRFIHIINHYLNHFEVKNLLYNLYIDNLIHREYSFEDIIHKYLNHSKRIQLHKYYMCNSLYS